MQYFIKTVSKYKVEKQSMENILKISGGKAYKKLLEFIIIQSHREI